MIERNYSWQWYMECLQATLCLGAFVRKLLAFHCLFSNHNLPRYLKRRCHDSWFISYMIPKWGPASYWPPKTLEKCTCFFYYVFIYILFIYIYIHHVCHIQLRLPVSLLRAYPSRCTLPCKTYRWRWGHLAALLGSPGSAVDDSEILKSPPKGCIKHL